MAKPRSLLGNYLQFLRSPVLTASPEVLPNRSILNRILRIFSPHLLLELFLFTFILQDLEIRQRAYAESFIRNGSPGFLLLTIGFVCPVVEEVAFRLPLRAFDINLGLSGALIIYYAAQSSEVFHPFSAALITLSIAFNIYLWLMGREAATYESFYERHPGFIFYTFALLSCSIYINCCETDAPLLLLLLVIPYFSIGMWLGFVRIRYGFKWAVFAHSFHNCCLLLPVFMWNKFDLSQALAKESISPTTSYISDQFVAAGISLYEWGGLLLCLITTFQLLREWWRLDRVSR